MLSKISCTAVVSPYLILFALLPSMVKSCSVMSLPTVVPIPTKLPSPSLAKN